MHLHHEDACIIITTFGLKSAEYSLRSDCLGNWGPSASAGEVSLYGELNYIFSSRLLKDRI